MIIGLTGKKLSGKGTVSDYLVENYNAKHYRFSKILEDICTRLYLPKTRDNMIDVALGLRDKFGNEILAHVLKKDIENDASEISVVDGIRYWEEYNVLKHLSGFTLIAVTADLQERFKRAGTRGEKVDEINMTFTDFEKQEQAATEVTISDISEKADFEINNNSSLEELYSKIDKVIENLK